VSFQEIFDNTRTIAVVGLSANPARASFDVAQNLQRNFKIIPVNPRYTEVLGETCYPDLESVPDKIDVVDVFQRSENVMPFVQPAIDLGVKVFWMQLGIENAEARQMLEAAGITVVEDCCTKVEYARL
jgi:predicted CoA-binding protein